MSCARLWEFAAPISPFPSVLPCRPGHTASRSVAKASADKPRLPSEVLRRLGHRVSDPRPWRAPINTVCDGGSRPAMQLFPRSECKGAFAAPFSPSLPYLASSTAVPAGGRGRRDAAGDGGHGRRLYEGARPGRRGRGFRTAAQSTAPGYVVGRAEGRSRAGPRREEVGAVRGKPEEGQRKQAGQSCAPGPTPRPGGKRGRRLKRGKPPIAGGGRGAVQCRADERSAGNRNSKGTSGSVQQRSIRRAPLRLGLLGRCRARRIDRSSLGAR
jgi:hypothetical protein